MKLIVAILVVLCAVVGLSYAQQCQSVTSCIGITCGVNINAKFFNNNTLCRTCTWNDVGTRFTECENGKKSLFYFWKPPATCLPATSGSSNGLTSLPAPVTNLDCSFHCPNGLFYNATSRVCQECRAGSYARPPGVAINTWFAMPPQMTTTCERGAVGQGTVPCQGWRLQGDYIDSNNNANMDNIRSALTYKVEVTDVSNAYVGFEYRVQAEERYDFLRFTVNERSIFTVSNADWTYYRLNLTQPGFYTFSWIYSKDISIAFGEDMAKIRKLEVVGAGDVLSTNCEVCQPGYFSDGTKPCQPCPAGQYAPTSGSSSCMICPGGSTSFIGSTSCFASSTPCTVNDYVAVPSACVNNQRTRTYELVRPVLCNQTDPRSIPTPAPITEACPSGACYPGQIRGADGICRYCPAGTFNDGNTTVNGSAICAPCPTGQTTANLNLYYTQFFNTPSYTLTENPFRTGCSGECRSQGWRFVGNYADSGLGNGIASSWMEFDVTPSPFAPTEVTFDYLLTCQDGVLEFYKNKRVIHTIECSGCKDASAPSQSIKVVVPETDGTAVVGVKYTTRSTLTSDPFACDRAVVRRVSVIGSLVGGAAKCLQCPAGSATNNSITCDSCEAGTYAQPGSTTCKQCPANTFSLDFAGSCTPCGNGTVSQPGSSRCTWQYGACKFQQNVAGTNRVFNWKVLSSESSAVVSQAEPDSVFMFNLCGGYHPVCGNNTLLCKVEKNGDTISLGDNIDIRTIYSQAAQELGTELTLTTNDATCYNNATQSLQPYTASIRLLCRGFDSKALPYGPNIGRTGPCSYAIEYFRDELCPLCTANDFYPYKGDCVNGKQEERFLRISGINNYCFGGVDKTNQTVTGPCQGPVVSFPYWVLVVAGAIVTLVIVAMAAVAFVFYWRYRRLHSEFVRLRDDQDNEGPGL